MKMDEKINLDEIQEYLRLRNGLLFDNNGDQIIDIYFDEGEGEIIAILEGAMKIIIEDLDELHKRMVLVRFLQKEERGLGTLNWKIKEMQDFYNSNDFQYAGLIKKKSKYTKHEADKIANELEQVVKNRLDAEKFLIECEIKKLKRIEEILKYYERQFKYENQYYMDYYNEKGEKLGRNELQ